MGKKYVYCSDTEAWKDLNHVNLTFNLAYSDHDVCKNKIKQKHFKTHQISVVKQVMLDI